MQDAAEVHVDHLVPVIERPGVQGSVDRDAGHARQNVEAPEPLGRQLHQGAQILSLVTSTRQ
jgi:hypothetical protein